MVHFRLSPKSVLALLLCATIGSILSVLLVSLSNNDGTFTYALDDPYIHIALAKTLSESGTWGFAPGEFASGSSSPLWTILLAALYFVFGVQEWMPLAIGTIANGIMVCSFVKTWSRANVNPGMQLFIGLFALLVIPVSVTANMGMEHGLHAAFLVLVLSCFLDVLSDSSPRCGLLMSTFAFLATATRYESLFVLFPLALALLLFRKPRQAFALLSFAILPVVIFGAYSGLHGGHFLPNSLLLKGSTSANGGVAEGLLRLVSGVSPATIHVYLLLALFLIFALLPKASVLIRVSSLALSIATVGQMILARVGIQFRYEAYLLCLGCLLLPLALKPYEGTLARIRIALAERPLPVTHLISLLAGYGIVLLFFCPFLLRGVDATKTIVRAPREIHGQQGQMARIFKSLSPGQKGCVAINDLGLMALHSDCPIVDLWGLGSRETANLKMEGLMNRESLGQLFAEKKVRYVAVFNSWFPASLLPSECILVGILQTSPNIVCNDEYVRLYVTDESDRDSFRKHLEKCSQTFPEGTSISFAE